MNILGIERLDNIPDGRHVLKNKYNFYLKKKIIGSKWKDTQLLSLTKYGIKKINDGEQTGKVPASLATYQKVDENDLVMCLFDLDVSAVFSGISDFSGMISPAYKCFKCKNHINPRYADYYYQMIFDGRKYKRYSKNVRFSISGDEFMNLSMLIPPINEQEKISKFLDKKILELNSIYSSIENQIEKLEKYKNSIISDAVIQGIDNNTEQKDSGIIWSPRIPSHWNVIPFKYVLKERNQKNKPIISNERLSLSIGLGVTLYSEKTTNLDRFKDDVSQYKIAHKGDLVMNSMNVIVGAVGVSKYFGCVSPAYYTFYDEEEDHILTRYCEYVFLTQYMRNLLFKIGKGILAFDKGEGQINTCRLKVSKYDLGHLKMPVPPIEEVRRIVTYLDKKCENINNIIDGKREELELLEKYKKSLIYEYVTGKKETPSNY